jgi:hypothetical protein
MWLFALARLGDVKPEYRERGVALARDIHPAFVIPGRGVIWKMSEDLSGPYPGYGLGAMDAYDGYVSYRLLDEKALASEIADMRELIELTWRTLEIEQDFGLGMMLWLTHFFPDEAWAQAQATRALRMLDAREIKFAFTNYGVSLGLQSTDQWPARVAKLNTFFEHWRSGKEYDREAITWVMACTSHLPGVFMRKDAKSVGLANRRPSTFLASRSSVANHTRESSCYCGSPGVTA